MQIEEYRAQLDRFHEALLSESLAYRSGRREFPDLAVVYADHADLYSADAVRELGDQLDKTPASFPSRRKSLARLRSFAIAGHLAHETAGLDQEIARREFAGSFLWDGSPVGFPQLPWLLVNEPETSRRKALQRIAAARTRELEPLRLARLEQMRAASARIGYAGYLEALEASSGLDLKSLSAALELVIAGTEAEYCDALAQSFCATLGVGAGDAGEWDAGCWEKRNEPAGYFRKELLAPALDQTFAGLELQPEIPGAIACDLDSRPGKPPGAWCIPVRVPRRIHVVATLGGGFRDYPLLLHEMGHAHHFAWTGEGLASEYRLLGDAALAEAFGFLFERLARSENWLMENFGYARQGAFGRFQGLNECYAVRRQVGMLRFQIDVNEPSGAADAPERYADVMKKHTGLRHAPEFWAADTDAVRCAGYLRGWVLEAMLQEYLRTKYGASWHRNRAAGRLLKEIWETGQLYGAEELSRELGLGGLDPQILTDRLLLGLRT